jgi:glycosyltransferase involved in cell wall biosynthesis
MRILVVQESDWIGRNLHQQHHMLERISAQGHEVVVVDYPIRWRDEGTGLVAPRRVHRGVAKIVPGANVTVIRTAKLRIPGLGKLSWLATNVVELARIFRTFRPDVVVILGLSNGLAALRLAKLSGVPVVVHLIDALHTLAEPAALRPLAARVERALLRGADRVVVINKALAGYAVRMGARPERVERIPTGADIARFGPHIDGSAVRAEYGIAPDEQVLLFVGWLYTFSGLRELAEAMADDPVGTRGMRLLVVGDGDLMPDLARVRDERLGDRLVLAGQQPAARMPEFMAAADICLLPAHANETMAHIVPAKIYEYLAAGKPILATLLPGLHAEFGDASGICFAESKDGFLARIKELARSEQDRKQLAAASRHTAEANGGWDSVTEQFFDCLRQPVGANGSAPVHQWR